MYAGIVLLVESRWTISVVTDSIRNSIVASIPACHAGDRGSIPRFGALCILHNTPLLNIALQSTPHTRAQF